MTAISRDRVLYNEKYYDVLGSGRLFDAEKKYELKLSQGSTFNPSGFHCDFKIADMVLYLFGLSFSSRRKPNKGFFGIGSHPPIINGVNPSIEKDPEIELWNILYEEINLKIPFTGQLSFGDRQSNTDGLDDSDYGVILNLKFNKGRLLSVH